VVSATARRCASGAWNGQPNRVFDVEVDPQLSARGGTGKHSPSDAMFAAIRLHADTASALSRALDVIRKGEASPHAAAGGAFTDFLRHFNVIQIFESSDKQVKVQGQALVPAEQSLLESGHLLCGGGAGLASGACKHNYLTYSARCDTSVFADNRARCSGAPERKPVCRQVWNIDDKIWEQKIECDDGTPAPGRWVGGGSTPECSRAGSPMCGHGEKLFDLEADGEQTWWPVSKYEPALESDFVTVSLSKSAGTQLVDFVEVTRIDIEERREVATGEADSIGVLEVAFSDGKTQQLLLAVTS